MPFDAGAQPNRTPPKKVAVIGAGVSGLSAAWLLSQHSEVIVYESAGYLGGHANTVEASTRSGPVAVDAGFIVFNKPNYPNFTALLEHLNVATEPSCMSFAASLRGGAVEYSGQSVSSVFANRALAASPSYWRMLGDIVRFHRAARGALDAGLSEDISLREFVAARGYGDAFERDFLEPMASAIWSTPAQEVLDFPASSFIKFFSNHGLLQVLNLPIWHTVRDGSRRYVEQISRPFAATARLNTPVASISRDAGGVVLRDASGHEDRFDAVVVATHANTALSLLENASDRERSVLGAFHYQPNRAVVHFDEAHMPKRKRAWASWNYIGDEHGAAVTYWMNRLQNLPCEEQIFVTLNPQKPVPEDKTIAAFDYEHPMFNIAAGKAQSALWSLQGSGQGSGGVWFCGAHFGQGFHEDGLQAGLAVAEALGGARRPWRVENESSRIQLPAIAAE